LKVAYVDTSWLLAIAFGETAADRAAGVLLDHDALLSAPILEAELLAALHREGLPLSAAPDPGISWILPDRPLRPEIERVLEAGYVRGADLWHLASALYAADSPGDTRFLTFDVRQGEVAAALGFEIAAPGDS
jgi:predicted nucleic acid-binding protein